MRTLSFALLFCLLPAFAHGAANDRREARLWQASVVSIEVTRQQYDHLQPWTRQAEPVGKAGVIIAKRQILTTARDLEDVTLIRVQKGGRGQWWTGALIWADYLADVALVTVAEDAFWDGLKPVILDSSVNPDVSARIVRWNAGTFEMRKAEVSRFDVTNPSFTDTAHVFAEFTVELAGAGWGEPVFDGKRLIGLVFAQVGNACQTLPAPFIRSILDARSKPGYRGLGYFDFTWQPTVNPETHRFLRWDGPPRGVVVIDVIERAGAESVLRPRDLLIEVDGFEIDIQGDYLDPLYGHLMLENLATRDRYAGDAVPLKIWRDGQQLEVDYLLPEARNAARLVPAAPYNQEPSYVMLGGLVFQPLTRNYLRSWGENWEQRAPFRLSYFRNEEPTPERPSVVVLSQVLPDFFNLGYQEVRNLVLERLNDQPVSSLAELVSALDDARDGFHVFDFMKGDSLQRVVLEARQLDAATRRVQDVYGIQEARVLPPNLAVRDADL
jgi:S1-C subfamily serine protease